MIFKKRREKNYIMKKTTFLSQKSILTIISNIIDFTFFQNYIGHTNTVYLLVYIAGLIICRKNNTMTNISRFLKLCYHDSLQRMLNKTKLPCRVLSEFFISWLLKNRPKPGYLIIDDTLIEKEHSKKIQCAGYAYSSSRKKSVMGIHIVVMYWSDGDMRIPVGFRLWMPKNKTNHYKTKIDLAIELLTHNDKFCESCSYITFDSWYCSDKILRLLSLMKLPCISSLKKNRNIVFKGRECHISSFRAKSGQVNLPGFGSVLIYRDEREDGVRYLMSTDVNISAKEVEKRYISRWSIEENFRFIKGNLGLNGCQCRKNPAVENHISSIFLAHFVMEVFSAQTDMNVYGASLYMLSKFFGFRDEIPKLQERRAFLQTMI